MPEPVRAEGALATAFRSFRHRNYRLWFVGQLVAVFGMWTLTTAQGFLAYELTGSAALLGYLSLANGLPSWLLMLFGGLAADRFPRRGILVVTQSISALVALVLAVLTFAGAVRPGHILILAAVSGVAVAFDAPARHAIVFDLVEREDLVNAIALNSTMFNLGTALGPAFGGMLYAAVGPGSCFAVGVLTPLATVAALLAMSITRKSTPVRSEGRLKDIVEGVRYARGSRDIMAIVVLVSTATMFGFSVFTLFPAWAVEILRGDARTNGLLQSARGLGAVVSAFGIAALGSRVRVRGLPLVASLAALPVSIALFAVARSTGAAMIALLAVGGLIIALYNLANSLVQTLVDDRIRGRVMGIYSLTFFGFLPLGGWLIGELAERLGLVAAVWLNIAALAAAAAWIWFRAPWLRKLE
jgi:predicted MFS family arabinose efflux permease